MSSDEQPPTPDEDAATPAPDEDGSERGPHDDDGEPAAEAATDGGPRRPSRARRRLVFWTVAGVAAVLVAGVVWVAVTALLARRDLTAARADVSAARRDLVGGSIDTAGRHVADARSKAHRAHQLTTGPAWVACAHLPIVGSALTSARGVTAAVDRVSTDVLPPLIAAADGIDPDKLILPGGRVDVAAIQKVAPQVARAADVTAAVQRTLQLLPADTRIGAVDRGRQQFAEELTSLQNTLDAASLATRVVPPLLGASSPQRYFVGFLNSAESRGVGGLPGAFAIVVADHGTIRVTHYESDTRLNHMSSGVDLGAQYNANYGGSQPENVYINSTISPNFPDAARIWAGMWQRASGEKVDGAIALDPTALSYLLRVTGAATTAHGQRVSAGNVVALTEQVAYARYTDTDARKQFLLDVAEAVAGRILADQRDPVGLLKALGKASGERRLLLWTSNTSVEPQLATLPLSGVIPDDGNAFAAPIVVNAAGGKLDYYLQRGFRWSATGCGTTRTVTATVTLRNAVPSGPLPAYVTTRLDTHKATAKPGDNRLQLRYFATAGATLTAATVNGKAVGVVPYTEQGHPLWLLDLELPRGSTTTVVLTMTEPNRGTPTVWTQPLVQPMNATVSLPTCR